MPYYTKHILLDKIKILFFISIFTLFTTSSYSQKSNNKGKLKTIFYKNNDYGAIGYVYKNQFVKETKLSFIKKSNIRFEVYIDTVVSGRYYCTDNGVSYIEGVRKIKNNRNSNYLSSETILKGVFKITNNKDDIGITTNKKYGQKLKFHLENLSYYKYTSAPNRNWFRSVLLKKISNDNYSLKIDYDDVILNVTIPYKFDLKNDYEHYNSEYFDDYIKKSKQVKLSFKNGDTFIGSITSNIGSNYKADYAPNNGLYKYKTGEVCEGEFYYYNYFRTFILKKGITTFTDGATEKDEWLSKYGLNYEEIIDRNENIKSLTEMRAIAINMYNEKERKIQEKKTEDLVRKREIQKYQKKIIKTYGEYFGNYIINREIVINMTQDMINEIWKKEFFNISVVKKNNKIIELWKFDKEKMQLEIIKNNKTDSSLAFIIMMMVSEKTGNLEFPNILIFENNLLVEIHN